MLLKDKVAVIYGTDGIAGAVAREFASEGATVFVTGREWWLVELVTKDIIAAGGYAEPSVINTLNEEAVDEHLQSVIRYLGHVDISFNAVGMHDVKVLGPPKAHMDAGQFSPPITAYITSSILTARLAGRYMIANKSGVIMTAIGLPAPMGPLLEDDSGQAQAAREAAMRDLSCELTPHGIRVVGLHPEAIPETDTVAEFFDLKGRNGMTRDQFRGYFASTINPKRVMTLDEVAKVAVLVASDRANGPIGTAVNLTRDTIDGNRRIG